MDDWPDWLDALRVRGDTESAGEHIARIVRALSGVSLTHDRDKLEALFLANETPEHAREVATWATNCASSARAIYALAGVSADHDGRDEFFDPLRIGEAMTILRAGAAQRGAVHPASEWRKLGPGWLMVYWLTGNDAHVEWCLTPPGPLGVADHGGGGRPGNAITVARGSILSSCGRPLREIYDPEVIADNPATGDNPY